MKITRLIPLALGLTIVGATGCTPQEIAFWEAWHAADPQSAESFLTDTFSNEDVASASVQPQRSAAAATADADTGAGAHCYILVGGNYCAYDGTPEAERYAADQAAYFASFFREPDPGPQPYIVGMPIAPYATPPQPDNVRCFILVGGNYCFAEGTEDYAKAEIAEREYLDWVHSQRQEQTTP